MKRGLFNSGDVFITKLNAAGSQLVFSTYRGGSKDDAALGIAIDSSLNIYVGGFTLSRDLPVTAAVPGLFSANLTVAGTLPAPAAGCRAMIAGLTATVLYCGAVPDVVTGEFQLNLQLPPNVPSGSQPVVVQIGTAQSQANLTVFFGEVFDDTTRCRRNLPVEPRTPVAHASTRAASTFVSTPGPFTLQYPPPTPGFSTPSHFHPTTLNSPHCYTKAKGHQDVNTS